jgi:hypothetical protein
MVKNSKTDCYKCKWRGEVIGSTHSSCKNPELKGASDNLDVVMAIFASVGRTAPQIDIRALSSKFEIRANPHGIRKGWFNWPWNFDPVWLENCNAFEGKANGSDKM